MTENTGNIHHNLELLMARVMILLLFMFAMKIKIYPKIFAANEIYSCDT